MQALLEMLGTIARTLCGSGAGAAELKDSSIARF